MRFIDLEIAGFGKLVDTKIKFDKDFTVIYGQNETGKSTLHACLRAMLFGMPRARGAASHTDAYALYRPWHSRRYKAALRVENEGHVYRIVRDFAEDPMNCSIFDETMNVQCENPDSVLETMLGGLSARAFDNTVSIGQLRTGTDASMAQELRERIISLSTTGDSGMSAERAKKYLESRKASLEDELVPEAARSYAANTAEIKRIEEEVASRETSLPAEDLETLDRMKEELGFNNNQISTLKARIRINNELDKAISKHRKTAGLLILPILILVAVMLFSVLPGVLDGLFAGNSIMRLTIVVGSAVLLAVCLIAEIILRADISDDRKKKNIVDETGIAALEERNSGLEIKIDEIGDRLKRNAENRVLAAEKIFRLKELRKENSGLEKVMENNAGISADIESIDLAIETMAELSETMQSSFGYHLNKEASQYIRKLTAGKYDALSVDDEFNIRLVTGDRLVGIESLSAGTKEQVYLAVRLASAKLMEKDNCRIPIILDDSFVNYDDCRMESAVRWLADDVPGQKILFSCQRRERNVIEDASRCRS